MTRSLARTGQRAVTSRVTFAVFALLLVAWGGFAADVAPGELFFPMFPAFTVAFFFDTVAYNQLGVRAPWLFSPLAFVCLYAEAVCIGWAVELYRDRRAASSGRSDDA